MPLAAGVFAYHNATNAFWNEMRPSILVALSVVAAGVLVRLARGLPFSNPEQFALDEVRRVTAAYKLSVRALRALVAVLFCAALMLAFSSILTEFLQAQTLNYPDVNTRIESIVSALTAFILVFVFVRIFAVVNADVSLVDMQSESLVKFVERRQGAQFQETQDDIVTSEIKNPENYGKVLQ